MKRSMAAPSIGHLRALVIARDRQCIPALLDPTHECRDAWGAPHMPDDMSRLTLGHVRQHAGGMRRDHAGWCIAQCFVSNLEHWESSHADLARAYLAGVRSMM